MSAFWAHLFNEDRGQDLADYCLLIALMALIGLGIAYRMTPGVHDLWTVANTSLASGNAAVSSTATGSSAGAHDRR
jgi:hypothetical protein